MTLASAVAINCIGAVYGVQLFTELPPLTAVAASSNFHRLRAELPADLCRPAYDTVNDERIETPMIIKDCAGHA